MNLSDEELRMRVQAATSYCDYMQANIVESLKRKQEAEDEGVIIVDADYEIVESTPEELLHQERSTLWKKLYGAV